MTRMKTDLSVHLLSYAAAGAYEPPPVLFVNPLGERQALRLLRAVRMRTVMFAFGVLRAAMFAEPAIPQIEEMGGLVHSISAAHPRIPSSALEPTSFYRLAKSEPELFPRFDVCREHGTGRPN